MCSFLNIEPGKNTKKRHFFGIRTKKKLPKSEVLRWSVYIFWSSCNLFEAIERFTILFLKHVWSSNKKVTDVISPYRSYSQVFFLPKDHKDIHNVVSFQMLTNKYSTSVSRPVFFVGTVAL